ncbi:MarR family winged helix-turn-helix transcriptional regulator [Devosia geojensis]|nr:MarR family winged helix-turn-helix transcriptional regulator [Devosia geojensis]
MSKDNAQGQKKPVDQLQDHHVLQLIGNGMSPRAAEAAVAIDSIMGNIRRSMARRELMRMAVRDLKLDFDPGVFDVMSVVESCAGSDREVTVGTVAERLNVDPSRASRIVSDAVEAGVVKRVASQADARRICLELTDAGRRHALAVRKYKWQRFADALGDWPEEEVVEFARLFTKFSGWIAEADAKRARDAEAAGEKD